MRFRLIVPVLLCFAFATEASACGESLYRVGKGIAYREYTAPLPGNLLVYGAAGDAESLAVELGRAGHRVSVAESMSELFQVVIGPFSEFENFQSISVLSEATYLPIATAGVDERAAKAQFKHVMVPSKHEIKHYLKAIHKVLKSA